MKESSATGSQGRAVHNAWAPPSPGLAIYPGVALTFIGVWMLLDGGPPAMVAACLAIGVAFLLTGAIAEGVAWGLRLDRQDRT